MFEVYGAPTCTWCEKAKWLLDYHKKPYTYIDVTESADIQSAFFRRFPKTKTVPQIVFDGHDRGYEVHIGGYEDLERWLTDA